MCNHEKLHFSWWKVLSFRYWGKLLMFDNCALWRKKEDFHVQGKGNKITYVLPSVLNEGGGNETIKFVFIGRGPGTPEKEIILEPEETWRSWNVNLALTEFSKEKLSCFHKYLWVFRDENLLLPTPCFYPWRSFGKTCHPENFQIVLA